MTAKDIQEKLKELHGKLEAADVEQDKRLDMQVLMNQLKMQMILATFDALKDLDEIAAVDLSEINRLIEKVDGEMKNEQARGELVGKVMVLAKTGLRAAGVPVVG